MKIHNQKLVILFLIYFINFANIFSFTIRNNDKINLLRKKSKNKMKTSASDEGLRAFSLSVFQDVSKHSYLPPNSCDPKSDKTCRGIFESIAIAYDRALKFGNFISIEECRGETGLNNTTCLEKSKSREKLKSIYLVEKNIKLKKEETNRFVFSISMTNDGSSEKSDKIGSNYLIKVCVPNNKTEKYFIDYNCPHEECDSTFSESFEPKECSKRN